MQYNTIHGCDNKTHDWRNSACPQAMAVSTYLLMCLRCDDTAIGMYSTGVWAGVLVGRVSTKDALQLMD